MREIIRFAWGFSSLGDFVVAMSDKGIAALEFSSLHSAMEDALRIRFPEADLERSQEELSAVLEIVAGLIDDPAMDCDLPLDLRGTSYEVKVWLMLREIPPGETTTYGALAARAWLQGSKGGDRGDRGQSGRCHRPLPSCHQEGRVDLRLSLGCPTQTRAAGARAAAGTLTQGLMPGDIALSNGSTTIGHDAVLRGRRRGG